MNEFENEDVNYIPSKEDEKWFDSISKHIHRGVKKYKDQLIDFENYLTSFPSLGYKHKIGKAISKAISQDKYSSYFSPESQYYKARKVVSDIILKKNDFKSPPIGKSEIGRFNWEGQSVLYLSTSKEGACEEICDTNKPTLVWIAKIKYEKSQSKILDLTLDPFNYEPYKNLLQVAILNIGLLNKRTRKKSGRWKPEYLMTNFIADCCKEAQYDGIAYTSAKYFSTNIVVFREYESRVKILEKPEIINYQPDIEHRRMIRVFDKNSKAPT